MELRNALIQLLAVIINNLKCKIMIKVKLTKRFLGIMLIGLIIFSCNKDELIEEVSFKRQNTDVSVDLAQQVELNFSSDLAFLEKPKKVEQKLFRSANSYPLKSIKEILPVNDNSGKPALYVIQFEPTGFVIVSGSKKETPILAFS